MADNNNQKNTSVIRIILCIAVLIFLLLGMFGVISKSITVPVSDLLLLIISLWNSIVYFREGRKGQSAIGFAAAAVLFIMLIVYFIKL